jgi:hypothetical protein
LGDALRQFWATRSRWFWAARLRQGRAAEKDIADFAVTSTDLFFRIRRLTKRAKRELIFLPLKKRRERK